MEDSLALVVSDDAQMREALSRQLTQGGLKTIVEQTAQQALDIVFRKGVTVVFCDWSLPNNSGSELCAKIRRSKIERYIYFIFMGDSCEVSAHQAIVAGADAYLSTPIQEQELEARLQSASRIYELQQKMVSRNDFLEFAYTSVTTDLKIAAKVQEDLLPRQFRLAGMNANWFFKPANFVAGDIFDYFPLGDDYFVFYILDVEGHGIASALTSFAVNNQLNPSVQGLCSRTLNNEESISAAVVETIHDLNRQFEGNLDSSRYFTMIYGVVEMSTGHVTMTQAGHPAPIHLSKTSASATELGKGGMPVGLLSDAKYSTIETRMTIGDRLFLYSDGMLECQNEQGEFYGSERLLRRIQEWRDLPIDELDNLFDNDITHWNGSEAFDDDVSMVILEYNGKY